VLGSGLVRFILGVTIHRKLRFAGNETDALALGNWQSLGLHKNHGGQLSSSLSFDYSFLFNYRVSKSETRRGVFLKVIRVLLSLPIPNYKTFDILERLISTLADAPNPDSKAPRQATGKRTIFMDSSR
jgi:hypothetical protein